MRMKANRFGISVLALATLSACASISPDEALAPISTPITWTAISNEASGQAPTVTADWLADLADPAVTGLVREAIAHNQDLAAAAARVRATRQRVGIARAGVLPTMRTTLGGRRSRSPGGKVTRNAQVLTLPSGYTNGASLDISLQWEMDVWGRLTDQTRSAYLSAKASALDYSATQLSIAGATSQAFYQLTESKLQRQLSERDVKTGETNLRIIERRYSRGISSSLDVRLARSSLAQSNATLISRQRAEAEAARRLEVLLGRYPGAEVAAAEKLPVLSKLLDTRGHSVGIGAPEQLLFRRPDIIAAERRLKSSGLDAAAARKALLPSFVISGGARSDGTVIPPLFDTRKMVSNIAAGISQPIFQGGRLRAQALAAREDVNASAAAYAQAVLTAYREVEDALAAETFLTAQYEAQRLAFEEAVAAEELTNRQYLNGTTNIFNLISAQQRRINSESRYIAAQRTRLVNRIDLYLALGAPFDAPSAQTTIGKTQAGSQGARL